MMFTFSLPLPSTPLPVQLSRVQEFISGYLKEFHKWLYPRVCHDVLIQMWKYIVKVSYLATI